MDLLRLGLTRVRPRQHLPGVAEGLFWRDRDGVSERLPVEAADYWFPRISPDGRRAAVARNGDIWILDLATSAWSRLTLQGGNHPSWTPDGTRVVFSSSRSGQLQAYWIPADGSGEAELFAASQPPVTIPASWSPDGEVLLALSGSPSKTLSDRDRNRDPSTRRPAPGGRWCW